MFIVPVSYGAFWIGVAKQCLLKNTGDGNGFLLAAGLPELEPDLDLQKRTPQSGPQGPQFNENGR